MKPPRPAGSELQAPRRDFLRFLAASPLFAAGAGSLAGCRGSAGPPGSSRAASLQAAVASSSESAAPPRPAQNVFDYQQRAHAILEADAAAYLAGGADDERTLHRNAAAFAELQIRARRLVDVSEVDTRVELFGQTLPSPLFTCPVGFQGIFHPEAERATARGTARRGHLSMVSSCATEAIAEVHALARGPVWFQLYPTPNPKVAAGLLRRAEDAGCRVVVLTVDTPIIGHRERHGDYLQKLLAAGVVRLPNYEGLRSKEPITNPSMTWDMIDFIRQHCSMKVVLKGLVTAEDARLAVQHGADGIVVSNHGGRQEESDRATIDCLPEVVAAAGPLPVLLDGGVRRGTDVFKALALGARAVGIGRPFLWGLSVEGADGVAAVLDLLDAELTRILQLAGVPRARDVGPAAITRGERS